LNFHRLSKVKENMDKIKLMNANNLFTGDVATAVRATMTKTKPVFPKL